MVVEDLEVEALEDWEVTALEDLEVEDETLLEVVVSLRVLYVEDDLERDLDWEVTDCVTEEEGAWEEVGLLVDSEVDVEAWEDWDGELLVFDSEELGAGAGAGVDEDLGGGVGLEGGVKVGAGLVVFWEGRCELLGGCG